MVVYFCSIVWQPVVNSGKRQLSERKGFGRKAQGKAPFIVLPMVHSFDFRVLRQNRRVVQEEARRQEIENFHNVLTDISYCECTPAVRAFIVNAYVRGAQVGGGSSELARSKAIPRHPMPICMWIINNCLDQSNCESNSF